MFKNTVGFYIIKEDIGRKLIGKSNDQIIEICGDWVKDQKVTVMFYGKYELSFDKSEVPSIKSNKFIEIRYKFVEKVFKVCDERKTKNKLLVILEDFKSLEIKNLGDQREFLRMINSIYYTKFDKKIIILMKVDDLKNMTRNGFGRRVIDKSKSSMS